MTFENQSQPDENGLYELKCGGPIVEPVKHRVYSKEQVDARVKGLEGKAIFDEFQKIEQEEEAILAQRAESNKSIKAAEDEDAVIEANTGDFTADDIKEALESRTPAMQALLRARPDKS